MAHEILSVKMYELDKKLEQTHSRIQLAESMEDILEDFNDNLKNVKKIYGSISDAITGNQGGKETVVKIS